MGNGFFAVLVSNPQCLGYVCCDRYIDILSSPTKKQSSEQLLHPYLAEDLGVVFECVGMILPVRKLKMIFSVQ